jgi:hypothetical protein
MSPPEATESRLTMEPNDTLPRGDWWEGKVRDSYGIPRIVLPDNAVLAISDLVVAEAEEVAKVFGGDTLTAIRLALTEVIRAAANGALDGLLVPVQARTAFGDAANAETVAQQIASEARSQSGFPKAAGEATRGAMMIVENVIEHVTAHLIALPPEPFAFAL